MTNKRHKAEWQENSRKSIWMHRDMMISFEKGPEKKMQASLKASKKLIEILQKWEVLSPLRLRTKKNIINSYVFRYFYFPNQPFIYEFILFSLLGLACVCLFISRSISQNFCRMWENIFGDKNWKFFNNIFCMSRAINTSVGDH